MLVKENSNLVSEDIHSSCDTHDQVCGTIRITGIVGDLESAIDKAYNDKSFKPDNVSLDLSQCQFVEVAALVWIIAYLSARTRIEPSVKTTIRLPRDKMVRDFMQAWAFPEAVRAATGMELDAFLTPEDSALFRADKSAGLDKMEYAGRVLKVDGIEQRLFSEGFFEITTSTPRKEVNPLRLADNENAKWREDRILAVLNRHLGRQGSTVSSHIVHEAMMNALRHPACRIIQAASFFDRPDNYRLRKIDLTAWRQFFEIIYAHIQEPTPTPGRRLWDYFPVALKEIIESEKGKPIRKEIEGAVIDAINAAICDRSFYRAEYFPNDKLPAEVQRLLPRMLYLSTIDVEKCNRYLITAFFPESIKPARCGHLTVVYRDDGESVVDTLGAALRTPEKKIRSVTSPELHVGYLVKFEDEQGRSINEEGELLPTQEASSPPGRVYWSEFTPEPSAKEHLVLFAALLPGITRDVSGLQHRVHDDVTKKRRVLGMPGMGLYILTSEAIDVFGGTVSIRTGNYFVNIRTAHCKQNEDVRYAVKIRKYGGKCPPFLGNMLTIRLPLH